MKWNFPVSLALKIPAKFSVIYNTGLDIKGRNVKFVSGHNKWLYKIC